MVPNITIVSKEKADEYARKFMEKLDEKTIRQLRGKFGTADDSGTDKGLPSPYDIPPFFFL